jgi:hypothetical protein
VDLVRRARVVARRLHRQRDVQHLPQQQQLPGVRAVQRRQLLRVLLHEVRKLARDPAPLLCES